MLYEVITLTPIAILRDPFTDCDRSGIIGGDGIDNVARKLFQQLLHITDTDTNVGFLIEQIIPPHGGKTYSFRHVVRRCGHHLHEPDRANPRDRLLIVLALV